MPYISKTLRSLVDYEINELNAEILSLSPEDLNGVLNYTITRILESSMGGEIKYNKINNLIGVLECVKLELYRRLASDYENMAMKKNGDVWETEQLTNTLSGNTH